MFITYRHLKSMIVKMTEKQLDLPVAVADLDDEDAFMIGEFVTDWKEGDNSSLEWLPEQLDNNHPFLSFTRANDT